MTPLAHGAAILVLLFAVAAFAKPEPTHVGPLPTQKEPVVPKVPPIVSGQFVKIAGTDFVVGGKVFRFVGANIDPIHGDTVRGQVERLFQALSHDSLSVARVWALGEGLETATEWEQKYALFRAGPMNVLEASALQLDRVLFEAQRAGVRVIVTLSNHWPDYGGVPMYLRWLGLPTEGVGKEAFYSDERAHALFRAHVGRLLLRKNSLTGVLYRDDPTIFAWELMNESTVDTEAGRKARLAWVREMSEFIKLFDRNHLVAAGLWGYAMRSERADFIEVHKLPSIDYVDSHLYLQNSQGGVSVKRLYDFLDDRAQLARFVVGKPLVLGEFGFRTDTGPNYLGWPRARWFSALVEHHFYNRGAGSLVWIYEPYSGKPRDFGIYIDRPHTDDVRKALRDAAALSLAPLGPHANPRLSPEKGTEPLYQVEQVLRGTSGSPARWQKEPNGDFVLRLAPSAFHTARFERLGVWDGKPTQHFYGAESGEVVFRLDAPRGKNLPALVEVEIRARLSSEWPGAESPKDGGSIVRVDVDDVLLGEAAVVPDDGRGAWTVFRSADPTLVSKLRTGTHNLRFQVPQGKKAHGLCVYGEARDPALGKEVFGPLSIRLRVRQ
jgi:mannan endo-1,4-beta-mannosidase